MKSNHLSTQEWIERIVVALLFVGMGTLIYIVLSPLRPMLDKISDYLARIAVVILLLAAVWWVRKTKRFEMYTPILLGLLIMAVTVDLDWIFSVYLLEYLKVDGNTPAGFAILKINECAVVVGTVIFLTRIMGGSLGSIYIQKGRLKLGLTIGLITFVLAAAGSTLMATLLFKPQDLSPARIISWLPWLLIFVLANGTQEELLFRGLFLRKLQPFFGKFISSFLIAFVFTFLHGSVSYTSDVVLFLAIVFPLALVWGYIMQKTDSVWGSILFHAGMDIPIMLGIFSNLA